MLPNPPLSASGRLRLLIGVALCSQLLMPTFAVADPTYDALIIQARNGNFTPALTQLRQLPAERQTAGQVSDHLVIAGWAGQDAEVLKVYEAQGKNRNLNTQALATVARTYRNQQQWAKAEAVYRQALLREPNNTDLQLGLALTQADGGQASEAVQRTRAMVAAKPDDPSRRMALGYALTRADLNYDALFEFDQAFIRAGDKPEVAREYIVALQKARLPEPALRLAAQRPGLVDAVTQRRLEGDPPPSGYAWPSSLRALKKNALSSLTARSKPTTNCSPAGPRTPAPKTTWWSGASTASARSRRGAALPR